MKISTILLAAAFMGLVCQLDMEQKRSARNHHLRSASGLSSGYDADSGPLGKDSEEYRELKARAVDVKKQIRDAESALQKIEENARFLERRLAVNGRTIDTGRHGSRSKGISNSRTAGSKILEDGLAALHEEKTVFLDLLDCLKCEEAALKVQIDLYGVSARRMIRETLEGQEEPGPLDRLAQEERAHRYAIYR